MLALSINVNMQELAEQNKAENNTNIICITIALNYNKYKMP